MLTQCACVPAEQSLSGLHIDEALLLCDGDQIAMDLLASAKHSYAYLSATYGSK